MDRIHTILVLLFLSAIILAVTPALGEEVKVRVLQTIDPSTYTDKYMLNTTANALVAVDPAKVAFLSDQIKDLDSSDDLHPVLVLSIDAPTIDVNTNESIVYSYVITNTIGTLLFGVADINTTTNTVENLQYFKVSPVSGDVVIVRTGSDIVIYANDVKMSIPLTNYTDPKLLLMTDSEAYFTTINYVELRSLRNPPAGYTLIRSGAGETEFTISANGELSIWFDETHEGGDVDLFIFDSSNSYFSSASVSQTWSWLMSHCTASIWSDASPHSRRITATGTVKFIVKRFSGNAEAVNWRIAVRLDATTTTQPPSQSNTNTQIQPVTTGTQTGLLARLSGIFENNSNIVYIVLALLFLLFLVAVFRR